ncbi:MAG: flagellar basal body P-ring protein FlgI [Planctomycetota bacterium]
MRQLTLLLALSILAGTGLAQSRISEITDIEGVRSNRIRGIGLVGGLKGTGDKSELALQMMANMVRREGMNIETRDLETGNFAVVMVTAEIDPYRGLGTRIDVNVASIQKATSLLGGFLFETQLKGPYGKTVYALAAGPLAVGGATAAGASGSEVTINVPTVGAIPGGAMVEKTVPMRVSDRRGVVTLQLKNPDWRTARNIAAVISDRWPKAARAIDSGNVEIRVPAAEMGQIPDFIADVQDLRVKVESVSKVVIDERNGIIVAGEEVRVSTVAVLYGKLSVTISEAPEAVPSAPFTNGPGATVVPRSEVRIEEESSGLQIVKGGESIARLSQSLDALGASPRQLIAILQQMKTAGALHAELVVK